MKAKPRQQQKEKTRMIDWNCLSPMQSSCPEEETSNANTVRMPARAGSNLDWILRASVSEWQSFGQPSMQNSQTEKNDENQRDEKKQKQLAVQIYAVHGGSGAAWAAAA